MWNYWRTSWGLQKIKNFKIALSKWRHQEKYLEWLNQAGERNMSLVDPIGDMFTRIRNGQMRSLNKIEIPFSNFRTKVLDVLKKEGYILNYETQETKNKIKIIYVSLKYYDGQPVIREIKRISKPGRRVYSRATSIPKVLNGLGLAILSTSKGVMSDAEATKNNLGGEIICRIF